MTDLTALNRDYTFGVVRKASRKGAKEKPVEYFWTCKKCREVVHREAPTGLNEDSYVKSIARTLAATEKHSATPCVKDDDEETKDD